MLLAASVWLPVYAVVLFIPRLTTARLSFSATTNRRLAPLGQHKSQRITIGASIKHKSLSPYATRQPVCQVNLERTFAALLRLLLDGVETGDSSRRRTTLLQPSSRYKPLVSLRLGRISKTWTVVLLIADELRSPSSIGARHGNTGSSWHCLALYVSYYHTACATQTRIQSRNQ